uniref:Uncharacterized protein n=1 Tax=Solanum lycopersicum TaxID=4081 RepID=A0A3Q7EF55_SOLLC
MTFRGVDSRIPCLHNLRLLTLAQMLHTQQSDSLLDEVNKVQLQRGLDEWRQTHSTSEAHSTSSSDITSIWINVAQSSKEMEAMRRQISKLTERLQLSEVNFSKVRKFMEKHMVETDESEGTDSDEE